MIMFIIGNISKLNRNLSTDATSFDHDMLILLLGFIKRLYLENAPRIFVDTLTWFICHI